MSPGYRSEQRILQHVALIHLIAISKNIYGGYGKSTDALNMLNSNVGENKVLSQQDLDPLILGKSRKRMEMCNLLCFFTNEMWVARKIWWSQRLASSPLPHWVLIFNSTMLTGVLIPGSDRAWCFTVLGVISELGVLSTGSKHFYELIWTNEMRTPR